MSKVDWASPIEARVESPSIAADTFMMRCGTVHWNKSVVELDEGIEAVVSLGINAYFSSASSIAVSNLEPLHAAEMRLMITFCYHASKNGNCITGGFFQECLIPDLLFNVPVKDRRPDAYERAIACNAAGR